MAVERLSSAQRSVDDGVSRDDEPDEREVGGVEHGDVSDSETGPLVMASFSVAVHRGLGVGSTARRWVRDAVGSVHFIRLTTDP
jgi:hypothetical protein